LLFPVTKIAFVAVLWLAELYVTVWPFRSKVMSSAETVKHVPAADTSLSSVYVVPVFPSVWQLLIGVPATAALTSIEKNCVVDSCTPLESFTNIANEKDPEEVGVPRICPVDDPSVKPAGRDPDETDHAYGLVPPVAAREAE